MKLIHKFYLVSITLAVVLIAVQCGTHPVKSQATKSRSQESVQKQSPQEAVWIVDLPGLQKDDIPLILLRIPAGSFQMGSPETEAGHEENESPQHLVTLSQAFYLGKCEVTQAQWKAVMNTNPSTDIGPNLPVNKVSWQDCQQFLHRLNQIMKTSGFRLPTEAEREYACRAGTTTMTYFGEQPTDEEIEEQAWLRTNSDGEIHPVGLLKPNPWGLHDMLGNVWEWCQDWYGPYSDGSQIDPTGPETGTERVFRGASWMARPEWIRCADRGKFTPDNQRNTGGFRIAFSD